MSKPGAFISTVIFTTDNFDFPPFLPLVNVHMPGDIFAAAICRILFSQANVYGETMDG